MNEKEQEDRLIDRYLAKELTPEEQLLFDQKMQTPDFAQKVALMEELVSGIQRKAQEALKNSLIQEEKELQKKQLPRKIGRWWSVAAAVLLFLLAFWWWPRPTGPEATDYFAQYFSPQKNVIVLAEKSLPDTSLAQSVFTYYDAQDYENALEGFDQLLVKNNAADYRFYQANALLALNRHQEALFILQNLLEEKQTQFLVKTQWLIALIYLHQNNVAAARPLLEALSDSPIHGKAAQDILQKIH